MNLIDRHVLSECLKTFAMALCAFVGLLLLQNVYDNLKDLIDMGVGWRSILYYYGVLLPSYLPTVLPLVFMISILFSLGQLHRNSEIVAMRACGLGLWKITRSIWVLGAALSLALFVLNAKIVPWSVEESRSIWDGYSYSTQLKTKSADEVGVVNSLAFNNFKDKRLWFVNRFSKYSGRAWGVMVSQLGDHNAEVMRVMASEGRFDAARGHWILLKGRVISFDRESQEIVRSVPFEEREFDDFTETPITMQLREKRAKDLSMSEVSTVLSTIPPTGDPDRPQYLVRYYSMGLSPLICLIVVGISVPFAVTGVRVNPLIGLSKAMGLFFAYYALASIATMMGGQGRMSPLAAAALPPACAAVLALWLAWRARFA